ncbi:citrate synthase [Brevundimonas sp. AJA228-03]|uniref:citrate/2-methylcitrate synthase n=1 Tax=Brevundimonas sp. AJA228-03 TaxID=2752515 RepID=UPI001AE015FE|nr:citrate/2-methylcitrate synthase [Brevundimonas sp. AJA228-03]QTN19513.1 citrate synthase [Brevundimonas sp. AJA228-03]
MTPAADERIGEAGGRWIPRAEVLSMLGVKTQTLYAYVSRGRITARPDPSDPRRSLYAAADVARLKGSSGGEFAGQVLPFEPAVKGEAVIQSCVSLTTDGRIYYRGRDATEWAQGATVEETARLLWGCGDHNPFAGLGVRVDGASGASPRARLFAALSRRAEEDEPSQGRDVTSLQREAATALNEVVDAMAGPGPRLFFHQRLARGWKMLERDSVHLKRALVLAADHDLNPAVLATRAAASGGASPAGAAMAGLAALSASPMARTLKAVIVYVIEARRDPAGAARRHMEASGAIPGFGSESFPLGDPRADALLALADLPPDLTAVLREGEAASGSRAGFAVALAVLARRLDLPREGALDMFLVGRLTGLMAHALDQITDGSPIRARLRYVGPRPGAE